MDGSTRACGTFSFTFAAEWDAVKAEDLNDYIQNSYSSSINERLDMETAIELLMSNGKWEPYSAVPDISKENLFPYDFYKEEQRSKSPLYNEYLYFNSHMRRLVYNQTDFKSVPSDAENRIQQYAAQVAENKDAVAILNWKPCHEQKYAYYLYRYMNLRQVRIYELPITSIELRLYSVGIMLLTIRCQDENPQNKKEPYGYRYVTACRAEQPSAYYPVNRMEDISWIENCGRRLFASRTISKEEGMGGLANDFPVVSAIALASEIPINLFTGKISNEEQTIILCDLMSLVRKDDTHCAAPEYLQFVRGLVNEHCISKTELRTTQLKYEKKKDQTYLVLDSFNDERMYLHGTIESPEIAARIKWAWLNRQEKDALNYLSVWYGILYSDQNWCASCQDPTMLMSAVEHATEARWCQYSTFHGMTYHSMIMLLSSLKGVEYLSANNDWIYLQMFLIAILQRCAVQRFYREASGLLQTEAFRGDDVLRAAVQDKYTLFLNQFWFYEVTEQEQGMYMFSKLQKAMSIERDVEFLDRALDELHQQQENRTSSMVNKLLVPMSIVGGFWAFTEMGLRLRDALVNNGYFNLMFLPKMGAVCAVLLLLCILWAMIYYLINQVNYMRKICEPSAIEYLKRQWRMMGKRIKACWKRKWRYLKRQ